MAFREAKPMKYFKKSDILIISFVIIAAATAFFLWRSGAEGVPAKAEIYIGSELKETIDLSSPVPRRFSLPERPEVVFEVFADGSISFIESDCPDKICVNSGRLKTPGETAACIPNLLLVKIVPIKGFEDPDAPDITTG